MGEVYWPNSFLLTSASEMDTNTTIRAKLDNTPSSAVEMCSSQINQTNLVPNTEAAMRGTCAKISWPLARRNRPPRVGEKIGASCDRSLTLAVLSREAVSTEDPSPEIGLNAVSTEEPSSPGNTADITAPAVGPRSCLCAHLVRGVTSHRPSCLEASAAFFVKNPCLVPDGLPLAIGALRFTEGQPLARVKL